MASDLHSGKTFFVFGLGRTGLSSIKFLLASGAHVHAWDDNATNVENAQQSFPEAHFNQPENVEWDAIEALLLSPGVPMLPGSEHLVVELARNHEVQIISDLDLLYLANPNAKYVGITGTNGKSTTTALIGHILQTAGLDVQVGGNIGIPVLDLKRLNENGVYVLETSSFQLDLINDIRFDIGVLLNITPDHLDRHGSMENYVSAKLRLFEHLHDIGNSIISIDYEETKELIAGTNISTKEEADVWVSEGKLFIQDKAFDLNGLKYLLGGHNHENIAAAFAVCAKLGVEPEQIFAAVKSFKGLKHRMELVAEIDGQTFINDSKATNADAAEKALLSFENIHWIVGGRKKEGGIEKLSHLLDRVQHAYLIGETQEEFAQFLQEKGCAHTMVGDLESALNAIDDQQKGVVLLSPACSSFDQFKDFEARGDAFCELVNKRVNARQQ